MTDYRDPAYLNDELAEEWGEKNGLVYVPEHTGTHSLKTLIPRGEHAEFLSDLSQWDHSIFDHARHYKVKGRKGPAQIAVVVTAPYLNVTLSNFSSEEAHRQIHETARILGLNVRVADPRDTIYISARLKDPTLPIVWWNPARFEMPLPNIDDPRLNFLDRLKLGNGLG
jgi:hypothetical protein